MFLSERLLFPQAEEVQEKAAGKTSPPGGAPAAPPGSMTKENGLKQATPTPFAGEGLRDPLGMDKRIPETSSYLFNLNPPAAIA